MRAAILAFLGGAWFLQTRAALPGPAALAICLGAAALGTILLRRHARRVLVGGLLGYLWAASAGHMMLDQSLSRSDEGRDLAIVGVVDSLPQRFDGGARFQFRIERAETPGAVLPRRVALSWYGQAAQDPQSVQPGERWRLVVRLQRPHGNANPHGFDYEAWLLEQGVRATGYVRPAARDNRRIDAWVLAPRNLVERSRALLRDRIGQALAGKPYAGVIVALVIGDQRGIAQSDWDVFNRTGISHLVSIYGL